MKEVMRCRITKCQGWSRGSSDNSFSVTLKEEVMLILLIYYCWDSIAEKIISRRKYRGTHAEVFCNKCFLRNFAKFTGKHLCQSLVFNKVAGLRPILLKKRLWHRCFPETCNFTKKETLALLFFWEFFAKFLRMPFIIDHFWWLLLKIKKSSKLGQEQRLWDLALRNLKLSWPKFYFWYGDWPLVS